MFLGGQKLRPYKSRNLKIFMDVYTDNTTRKVLHENQNTKIFVDVGVGK